MDKPYFIELTNKLYRLTFFFPAKEPLRQKIREVGDEILANLVLILEGELKERKEAAFGVERNIEILDALLELSKAQNWVEREETEKLKRMYLEIKKEVEEFNDILRRKTAFYEEKAALIESEKEEKSVEPKREALPGKKKEASLNERQRKIIEALRKKEKMQVQDFQRVLPKITKRTLRRDLSALVDKKAVKRFGKGNVTYYTV